MSDPKPMSDLMDELLRRIGAGDLDSWRTIEQDWPSIAGEPWTRHARPLSFHDGVLVVEAASPSVVSLLRYGTGGLLARLQARLGERTVREVKVRAPERR